MQKKSLRAMWLLNHSSARAFEIPMLKKIGIPEIFMPKIVPLDISFRSASVSFEEDTNLTIPAEDLAVLNAQDWYGTPSKKAWKIANQYFDLLFFIFQKPEIIRNIADNFEGAVLWRAYGLPKEVRYCDAVDFLSPNEASSKIRKLGRRFWFAQAYENLYEVEPDYIANRRIYLPLGMARSSVEDKWVGDDARIFFVCPDIEGNEYYKQVFLKFTNDFKGLPYAIGGAQYIDPKREEVLGFVPKAEHERNMRSFRLMYYHSTEPRHVHYHPFEAVRAGMPLIFMAGGLLDRLGGKNLPGRCETIREARMKIQRILKGDQEFIEKIRSTQVILLNAMKHETCLPAWQMGIEAIRTELDKYRQAKKIYPKNNRKKLAIIIPVGYKGGSLRGAKLLANALYEGSRQWEEPIDLVLLHLDDRQLYSEEDFEDIHPEIQRRPFEWRVLSAKEATRAMRYAGHPGWTSRYSEYMYPEDGISGLQDCDAWILISDRLQCPLLPVKPYMLMVFDYIQRYVRIMDRGQDQKFIDAARAARGVLVTTNFTQADALQYAGIAPEKLLRVPMLAPYFKENSKRAREVERKYFMWTTNSTPHKNHENSLSALKIYYEEFDGKLDCCITGVNSDALIESASPQIKKYISIFKSSAKLKDKLQWLGELSDGVYRLKLSGAAFLWHPCRVDNGTYSVIEAASSMVPALSSDYPAMREIDAQFGLNIAWMDPDRPRNMAEMLKKMEQDWMERMHMLPSQEMLDAQDVNLLASTYWGTLREYI